MDEKTDNLNSLNLISDKEIPRTSRYIKKTMLSGRPSERGVFTAISILTLTSIVSMWNWRATGDFKGLLYGGHAPVFDNGEVWRIVTGQLVHADFGHLASNSLMLFIFSWVIAGYFGVKNYLFTVFVIGSVMNVVVLGSYKPEVHLVGISGIVYLLAGYWLALFYMISRNYSVLSRSFRVIAFTLVVLSPSTFRPEVSYRAHAIGFIFGLFWGGIYFLIQRKFFHSQEKLDEIRFLQDQIEAQG